jgi:mannose PTS system EIIA component
MVGALIVTHGNLARELLNAAEAIEGTIEGIEAIPLDWAEGVDDARERIRLALGRQGEDGVIIFTDMFGGTPSNLALSFLEKDRVEIVTGVNLPMVVKFGSLRRNTGSLSELAHLIGEKGSRSIRVASDLLSPERKE